MKSQSIQSHKKGKNVFNATPRSCIQQDVSKQISQLKLDYFFKVEVTKASIIKSLSAEQYPIEKRN